jgi:hypothetical protein
VIIFKPIHFIDNHILIDKFGIHTIGKRSEDRLRTNDIFDIIEVTKLKGLASIKKKKERRYQHKEFHIVL